MRWLDDMPVGQKLIYGFGTIILLLAVVGILGIRSSSVINDEADVIYEKGSKPLKSIGLILNEFQKASSVLRDLVTVTDPAEKSKLIADRQKISEIISYNFKVLDSVFVEGQGKQLLTDLAAARVEYINDIKTFEAMAAEGKNAEAYEFMRAGKFVQSAKAEEKVLLELFDFISSENIKAHESAENTLNSTIVLMILVIAVAVFLGIFAAMMIRKSVNEPLKKGVEMMKKLSGGNVTARLQMERKDEIGDLARSMDAFAGTLQGFVGLMHQVAAGDVSVRVEKLDRDDQITPGLTAIIDNLKELISEASMLTDAAISGRLTTRGNVSKFKGAYAQIVKGVNDTLDSVILPVKEGSDVLEVMATGDLTVRVTGNYQGDHKIIQNSINKLGDNLSELIRRVNEAVDATASAGNQISSSTEEMAAGAQEQSSQTSEVASAVEEMTKTIMDTSQNAAMAAKSAKEAGSMAKSGGEVVKGTADGMQRIAEVVENAAVTVKKLGESSDQIGEIIQVIDDIADQTNLLALNAAIEAARAGEQGRGFAVVADEVRKLAERTTKATKEIADMIKQIQKDTSGAVESMERGTMEVEQGKQLAVKAGDSIFKIISAAESVVDVINNVATASEEQSSAAEQISKNIESINLVAQESASGVQQIARAAEDLSRLTQDLQHLTSSFKIDRGRENNYQKNLLKR
ncbi:Methyl-accepting chemotaxis protein McpQ [uncultured bacterium]|nr:Methyl-accepting chemotaxis protein McpQ [uncultured bacterium]